MSKVIQGDRLNKRFVTTCEVVFEPRWIENDSTEQHYFSNVVRPELERQAVEDWERSMANSD